MTDSVVANPTFSPTPEAVDQGTHVYVTLACATEGASIYYTLDGREPDASSAVYATPIPVPLGGDSLTITARAIMDESSQTSPPTDPSAAVSATYRRTHTTSFDNV